jgi:hypothetical protein
MVARPLPSDPSPESRDFASGSWTGRLDDAGEMAITFPNSEASDGAPWRSRFDPGVAGQRLQWLEIYQNGYLESCCCLFTVVPDRDQVQITGYDGAYLLKNAYERDWVVVESPRDVFERGSQLWVPVYTDSFPAGSSIVGGLLTTPYGQWNVSQPPDASVAVGHGGGLTLSASSGAVADVTPIINPATVASTGVWSAAMTVSYAALTSAGYLTFSVDEDVAGGAYDINLSGGFATLAIGNPSPAVIAQSQIASAPSYALLLESDGEWVWAFVNGIFIGAGRRLAASTTSLTCQVLLSSTATGSAVISSVYIKALQPFLMRGTDKGDYVLPGNAGTYPSGGLHARYYSDTDLASDTNRLSKILGPWRSQAYASSGTAEYQNQQDATVNGQANPTPGAAASNWSCKWFGAIWLKLSAGNYGFDILMPASTGVAIRVWIGQTAFGAQLVDEWTLAGTGAYNFTVTASALAGSLPYGGGTVQRDGWYPIKIEYAVDSGAHVAPVFNLKSSPAAYTDPGGTAIASGAQNTVVPATSLSPLGMVDQRFQGVAHFDLCQSDVLEAFGYQASVEPQQLESGLFPGVYAPRIREGQDTDAILEPDDSQNVEPMENYSNTLDATDCNTSLQGNGAGLNNGTQGQLQSVVFDPATLENSLYDVQGWQDFSDAAFPSLLEALLNGQLGLSLTPWQTIAADPVGRHRLADSWPLTFPPSLVQQRWRPGDGLRIQARDVNVQDTVPRQLLTVTRNFVPNGTTGVQATFASSPAPNPNYPSYSPSRSRTPAKTLKRLLHSASRLQRNYQKQLVTLTGQLQTSGSIAANTTDSGASSVIMTPADLIVRARVRIGVNSGAVSLGLKVNGTNVTSTLNGGWTVIPLNIDIGAVATVDSQSLIEVQVMNLSGTTATIVQYQLLVDCMR